MSAPWMPLYVADYLQDTTHLQALESGAYLHLIMAYWSAGKLPNDDRQLATIAKMTASQWKRARPTIEAFFGPGFSSHKRIDKELKRTSEVSASYSARATQAAKKRWSKHASSIATDMLENAELQPHSQKKEREDAAVAASPGKKYEFEHGIIRLTASDFAKWEKAFSYLDLRAELIALTQWAAEQGPQNWFFAVSGALAKRNRDQKFRTEQAKQGGPARPLTPAGNPWPEGIT